VGDASGHRSRAATFGRSAAILVSYGFRLIDSAGFGFSLGLAADR
jgi:hypothetical protein